MPAATLGQLANKLAAYTTPEGPTFSAALTQVLDRVYHLGMWLDITDEVELTVADDYTIAIPNDASGVLYWLLENSNSGPVRPLWHDYRLFGRSENNLPTGFGLTDAGYMVGSSLLDADEGNYFLRFQTENGSNFTGTESLVVEYTTAAGVRDTETLAPSGVAFIVTTETDIAILHSVLWSGVQTRVEVLLKNTDTDFNNDEFGVLTDPDGVLRTRRYRVGGAFPDNTVRVLLKLKSPSLFNDNSIIRLGNQNGLKHGLLAVIAEDNADLERAGYHWGECIKVFNEELGSFTDGQQFAVNLDMTGFGHCGIPNIQ